MNTKRQEEAATQTPAPNSLAEIRTAAVLEHQGEIRDFLRERDFGENASYIRGVLIEFVKFQATRKEAPSEPVKAGK
jgi:hypothetical protein